MQTKCNGCIFANLEGGEQVSCELGKLEKFKKFANVEKNEDGFYSIDKICLGYCPDNETTRNIDRGQLIKDIRKLNTLRIPVVVFLDKITQKWQITLNNIIKSELLPSNIIIVLNDTSIKHEIISYCRINVNIPWQIVEPFESYLNEFHAIVDNFAKLGNCLYFGYVRAGKIIGELITETDKSYNDDMVEPLLLDNGNHAWVCHRILYKSFWGYANPIKKIRDYIQGKNDDETT